MTEKVVYLPSGRVKYFFSYNENIRELHHPTKPAYIEYFDNGQVKKTSYQFNGKKHRADNPATEIFYRTGEIKLREWWIDGECHRVVLPAEVSFSKKGNPTRYKYFNHDRDITSQVNQYLKENNLKDPFDIPQDHSIIMKMRFW